MREKQIPFPTEPRLAKDYHFALQRTEAFAEQRKINGGIQSNLGHLAMQQMIAQTARAINTQPGKYESLPYSPIYNEIIADLPDLKEGLDNLDQKIGNPQDNKRKIIPFNHHLKQLINNHSSTTPANLEGMLKNTLAVNGYDNNLLAQINRRIKPGMEQELALEANLFHLPGEPEILDTTIEDELRGIDYIAQFRNGIEMTIDGKASEEAAIKAQLDHDAWRERNHITTPDTHLIIWTGYNRKDFIPNKIGRVTEEAREREQPRINNIIKQKYAELRQSLVSH
jgi:hypothetical protein